MEEPSDQHIQISAADIPMDGVDQHQVQAAIESDEPEVPPGSQASSPQPHAHSSRVLNKLDPRVDSKALGSNSPSPSATSMPPKKKGGKLLGLLRGGVKYSIEAALGADRFKAAVTSSEKSRDRLGVISDTKGVPRDSGPVSFKCRYQGKKGFLMIDNMVQGTPRVYWSKDELIGDRGEGLGGRGVGEKKEWELRVDQIVELKKVGGLDWKAKAVVAWATEREVADGLEIGGVGGMKFRITAVQLREELFNVSVISSVFLP